MKPIQLDAFESARQRDIGIERAIDHADREVPQWRDIAYRFLTNFIKTNISPFQIEDVRKSAENIIPAPPDTRAWGGVVRRMAIAGIIQKVGYESKQGVQCHRGLATLWQKK